ncbi:MAG: hypothetical protein CVV48_15645 [Spirochaetae bacterium HGW-Spirochaetae-4]|nr:MAG: hypothetical protein CVV48_15645 [Spirochaetae bacterium HGW-Spirochaetae-4]
MQQRTYFPYIPMENRMAKGSKVLHIVRYGFLVIALLVIGLGVVVYINTERSVLVQDHINRTGSILKHSGAVLTHLNDLVNSARGYLLSGLELNLRRVEEASLRYEASMGELKKVVADNPIHMQRIAHVDTSYLALKAEVVEPLLQFKPESTFQGSAPLEQEVFQNISSKSRFYLDELTRLIGAINREEEQHIQDIIADNNRLATVEWFLNILATLIVLSIVHTLYRLTTKRIRKAESEQLRFDQELGENHDRLASLIEATRVGTWEWDIPTGIMSFNERWAQMLGYSLEELEPQHIQVWKDLMHPQDLKVSESLLEKVFSRDVDYYELECRMKHKDGHWVWVLERGKVVSWSPRNVPLQMAGTHDDISGRKRIERLFYIEKNRLEATLMSVGDGVITTDMHGKVVMLNKVAENLTGWTIQEAKGEDFGDVFTTMDANTGAPGDNPVKRVLESGVAVELWDDSILVAKDGIEHFINDSASPIKDEQGSMNGVVLVFRDCSHNRTERETILRLGFTDQLTQLQNRRAYDMELEQMRQADLFPIAFILADVDGLKLANDAFSHDTGDLLLQRVANVLREVSAPGDLLARVGGDEFLVLMHQTSQELAEDRVHQIDRKLREEKVGHMTISLSTGIALLPTGEVDPALVYRHAERRMYRQKLTESPKRKKLIIETLLSVQHQNYPRVKIHSEQVSLLCGMLSRMLELNEHDTETMQRAGLYHDLGKIAMDQTILEKPSSLNEHEWYDVKRHSEVGYNILRSVPEYFDIAETVLYHHERWDGNGYPKGLAGNDIPLYSRMLSICDAYDAMVGTKPYANAKGKSEALQEIMEFRGSQFDPDLATLFVTMMSRENS